jgi:hypothetical protein
VIWLLGANLVLGLSGEGPAAGWINRKPEKFAMHWRRAWTVWPGKVHLEGVTLRGQNRHVQWWASLDRAVVDLSVTELPARVVHVRRGTGSGLRFRLRRRVASPELRLAHEPPIPGLENPPLRPPEDLYPPPPEGPGWRIVLDRLRLDGVREVWIDRPRFGGDGDLDLAMDFRLRDGLTLDPLRVRLAGAVRTAHRRDALSGLEVTLDARIDDLDPRKRRGWRVLEAFSGELSVAGRVRSLAAVRPYLPPLPGLALDGHGRLTSKLVLDAGRPRTGSRFDLDAEALRVALLDYRAEGRGTVSGALLGSGDPDTGALTVLLDRYAVRRETGPGVSEPYLFGEGLRFDLTVAGPELAPPGREPATPAAPEDVRAVLELPTATVPDWTVYNAYLPPAAGFRVARGGGTVRGRFELDGAGRGTGEIHLASSDLRGRFDDLALSGALAVDTALPEIDLPAGRFALGGSRVRLDGVRVSGSDSPGGWWARVRVPAGTLRPAGEPLLTARVSARMRDTGPLVALFARDKPVVGWFDDLLTVEGIEATGRVRLGASGVRLQGVEARGDGLRVLADLTLRAGSKRGFLYARRGRLGLAAELTGEGVDWRLRRPLDWYRQKTGGR